MNLKSLIKKMLTNACVYFSVITAIYSIIVMIIYIDDTAVLLDASRLMLFFVASVLVAAANGILKIEKLGGALKIIIHYLLTLFAFCSCLMLPISPAPSTMVVGIAIFTFIYLVAALLIFFFRSRYKAKKEQTDVYKSKFRK